MNFNKAQNLLGATFLHTCSIYEFKKAGKGSITKNERSLKYDNIKCQLSQGLTKPAEGSLQREYFAEAKLIVCGDIEIQAGSEIEVFINNGETPVTYECSGEPSRYPTHQEIMLKRTVRA